MLLCSILHRLICGRLKGLPRAQHDHDGDRCWVLMLNGMEPQNKVRGSALLATLLEMDSRPKVSGFYDQLSVWEGVSVPQASWCTRR